MYLTQIVQSLYKVASAISLQFVNHIIRFDGKLIKYKQKKTTTELYT